MLRKAVQMLTVGQLGLRLNLNSVRWLKEDLIQLLMIEVAKSEGTLKSIVLHCGGPDKRKLKRRRSANFIDNEITILEESISVVSVVAQLVKTDLCIFMKSSVLFGVSVYLQGSIRLLKDSQNL